MTCRRSLISSRAVSAYRPADLTTFRAECRFSLANVKMRSANILCLQSAATEDRKSRLLPSLPMNHPSGPAVPSEVRAATEAKSAPPRSTEAEPPRHLTHIERVRGHKIGLLPSSVGRRGLHDVLAKVAGAEAYVFLEATRGLIASAIRGDDWRVPSEVAETVWDEGRMEKLTGGP